MTNMIDAQKQNYDENEFFREVSIRICGSLEIEKALWRCYLYVRDFMPVDEMIMAVYDAGLGSMKIVATADATGGKALSDDAPLPPQARRELEQAQRYARVRRINSLEEDPICDHVGRRRGWPESSVMVNRLLIEGQYIGAFVVRAEGRDRYTDEHLGLWTLVNETAAIALTNNQRYREVSRLKDLLADDKSYLEKELRKDYGDRLVGEDSGLREVMKRVRMVAPLKSPVLITGETGTGKEEIANKIHKLSPRAAGPLITMNCGAIPEGLIDSELFGHEKAPYTGNLLRGRFERAHGGTIFLDEVSELTPAAQVRLLRVLEEGEVERVGGMSSVKVDVRIMAATNKDLSKLVDQGIFREDLYYRLNVYPILLPPLRARKGDIPDLVEALIQKKCREMGLRANPHLAPGVIDRLMALEWRGNVRELRNEVERAIIPIIQSPGKDLIFSDLPSPAFRHPDEIIDTDNELLALHDVEARHIRRVLTKTGGRINGKDGAAELLGMNSGTLRHKLRKLGIPFGRKTTYR